MEENKLYENIKKKICRMIFEDVYRDGELIPSERKLSEELGVSRVTLRKALKLLEEEHIIARVQGSGTRIALEYGARAGEMDIITLVAPAQNIFFSQFIDAFQTTAEELDSLVLFKQKPARLSLEKCLFQIYEKNLKNVVLWQEDMELSTEALRKLRGLGMNIVLFDTTFCSAYGDAVCLDNEDAIERLYQALQAQGCEKIGFVGWDELQVRSVSAREQAFKKLEEEPVICRIPWKYRNCIEELPVAQVIQGLDALKECDGVLYSVAELGIAFERKSREMQTEAENAAGNSADIPGHKAAMVDILPGAEELGILTMEQDFPGMAETIFDCLKRQNKKGSAWKPGVFQVKGILEQERRHS